MARDAFIGDDPQLAAWALLSDQRIKDAELYDLAYQLAHDPYCSRNDVTYLLSLLNDHMSLQEELREMEDVATDN